MHKRHGRDLHNMNRYCLLGWCLGMYPGLPRWSDLVKNHTDGTSRLSTLIQHAGISTVVCSRLILMYLCKYEDFNISWRGPREGRSEILYIPEHADLRLWFLNAINYGKPLVQQKG